LLNYFFSSAISGKFPAAADIYSTDFTSKPISPEKKAFLHFEFFIVPVSLPGGRKELILL